ncbi:SDR family oxidoreductase [Kineosporia sp. J2-2]|uniref:SDR family oxidoreductase n=1 Tax=Kineosporia corallincola TaxID=2835133 RepID=A0ABS5TFP3_9ACTN|nr:SDR family oxidoreductase [Kineosporia corallincola]MBT0769908.1 SDR family oxidoreductase [Kineosporia corallincola]
MQVKNSVALVTGANRGLGRHFAQALLERGAAKVYATARRPEQIDLPGVETLPLDITDEQAVARVADLAQDVTLLVNNAGASTGTDLVTGDKALIRQELDTFFWGTLEMTRAFAPILAANAGGAILNINSVMSWSAYRGANAYHVAKAAEWALTNGSRLELADQGTQVTGLFLAMTDTGHQEWWTGPLNRPEDVVRAALDGLEAGRLEIVVDEMSAGAKALLAQDPGVFTGQ